MRDGVLRNWVLAAAGVFAACGAVASTPDGTAFSHKDWELACDNTRTCRAAGYSVDGDELLISVLLTRKAGASEVVSGEANIGFMEEQNASCPATLRIKGIDAANANVTLDTTTCKGVLSTAQVDFLLRAAVRSSSAAFGAGKRQWTLSLDGARAVFLKMDELQGRLDTATALVRKGQKSTSQVLPPLAVPVIRVPKLPAARPQDATLLPKIAPVLRATRTEDCPLVTQPEKQAGNTPAEMPKLEARLSDTHLLVSNTCWRAAYNTGTGYWVVQDRPPFKAELVTAEGSGIGGVDFSDGQIGSSHKGRGLGDCWSSSAWAWDGKTFVRSAESYTGMCRGFVGGAWELPTYVSTVVNEK